jgi:hypothetical protein
MGVLDIAETLWMIAAVMQRIGAFLTACAARLAPFERSRVGGAGCIAALALMAAIAAALIAGLLESRGLMAGLRLVIGGGLAAVVLLFLGYACVETVVERSVRRRLEGYMSENAIDPAALLEALEPRAGRMPGGTRLLVLLRERTAKG